MEITTCKYRDWLDEVNAGQWQRAVSVAALDAFERAEARPTLPREDLGAVVAAATDRYAIVWQMGVDLLGRLAIRFPEAQEAMHEIMRTQQADTRFRLIANLEPGLPDGFVAEIIQLALCDKSYHVRRAAAMAVDGLERRDLVPTLEQRLSLEQDERVRESLTNHIALLRDGYVIEKWSEEQAKLTFRAQDGWISRIVRREDLTEDRLPGIIEETLALQPGILGLPEQETTS